MSQLRAIVERIERIESEIADMNSDKSDIFKEAKATGFDVKALKAVIAYRRKDPTERDEQEALFDLYLAELSGLSVKPVAPSRPTERLPREAFQPPRERVATLEEVKTSFRAGNPISQDKTFEKGVIYFAHFKELKRLKIGLTNNVTQRLEQLAAGCGCKPELIGTFEGNRQEELRALEHFASWNIEGEWFAFDNACEHETYEYLARLMHPARARAQEPRPAVQAQPSAAPVQSAPFDFPDIPAGLDRRPQ